MKPPSVLLNLDFKFIPTLVKTKSPSNVLLQVRRPYMALNFEFLFVFLTVLIFVCIAVHGSNR